MSYIPLPPISPLVVVDKTWSSYAEAYVTWEWPPTIHVKSLTVAKKKTIMAHELGHIFDMEVLEPGGWRIKFAEIDGYVWQTPISEERFAQTYALCLFNKKLTKRFNGPQFSISPSKFIRVCNLIRRSIQGTA